jgi:hypothetical protein
LIPARNRPQARTPRRRGLALPGTLLMLTLLALAMAAAQRGAAQQWRAARWECTRLQAREDAWAALRAAQAWVAAQGTLLAVQDCSTPRVASQAGEGRLCATAPGTPGDASWTRLPPTAGCAQACAFHVQWLRAPGAPPEGRQPGPSVPREPRPGAELPRALRLSAWAGGPGAALLQADVELQSQDDPAPRYVLRAWRALR